MDKIYEMGGVYNINDEDIFGRGVYTNKENIKNIALKRFKNKDVYCSAYAYDNKNIEESLLYGDFYLDIDSDINNDESLEEVKSDIKKIMLAFDMKFGIDEKKMLFYFSGCKGFHIIISKTVFNASPCKKLNQYYKEIAKIINSYTVNKIVDTRIYDNKRLLRLTNSINGKTDLYKVPITLENIYKFSYDELMEYAKEPKDDYESSNFPSPKAIKEYLDIVKIVDTPPKKSYSFFTKSKDEVKFPKCVQAIYSFGATKGCRNNTTIVLASCMLQQGLSFDDTCCLIEEWNDKLTEPLGDVELSKTLESAYKNFSNGKRYGCTSIKDLGYCDNQCR